MIKQTPEEKFQLQQAKAEYSTLKKNKELYTSKMNELVECFSKSAIPDFGSLIFNGKRI